MSQFITVSSSIEPSPETVLLRRGDELLLRWQAGNGGEQENALRVITDSIETDSRQRSHIEQVMKW